MMKEGSAEAGAFKESKRRFLQVMVAIALMTSWWRIDV